MKGWVRLVAVVIGLVVAPALAFAAAKSRPHHTAPPHPLHVHHRSAPPAQGAPSLPI